jgi:hypothetical protein
VSETRSSPRVWRWVIFGVLAALPWIAWRSILGLELLGWDAYPLIATAHVEGPGDLARLVTSKLMEGRYPIADYWRPLVHLSFGFDRAVWELEPLGYHITDLAILSGAVLAVFALARRQIGGGIGPMCAALVFGLHPVHFEILQAPARRADALSSLFTVLALACIASRPRRRWWAAMAVLAALASKETGAVAAGAVVVLAACSSTSSGVSARVREVASLVWPAVAVTLVWFGVRALVLGGMGGTNELDAGHSLTRLPVVVAGYGAGVFGLRRAGLDATGASIAFAVFVAFVAVCAYTAHRRARKEPSAASSPSPLGTALFLGLWFVGLALVTGSTGVDRAWYELPFLAIHALLVAWLIEQGLAARRSGAAWIAWPALALAAACMIADLSQSPLAKRRDDLAQAGERAREFLDRFRRDVGAAAPGSIVRLDRFPIAERTGGRATDARASEVTIFAPYSLVSYAEIVFPGRRVRPVPGGTRFERPAADEVVVVLTR